MSVTVNTPPVNAQPPGSQRYAIASFTGDSSYPTGGYPVGISAWGFQNYLIHTCPTISISGSTVYIFKYNAGTGKLQLFTAGSGGIVEVSNATNVSAFTGAITAWGY